jgi:predicted AAA+ superfamily ATPase
MPEIDDKYVERQIFSSVAEHLKRPEISIITGPRQTGKTTLLLQLKKNLIESGCPEKRIFFFNLDIIADLELFTSQQKFITFLKERVGKEKLFVFVDEAQRVENAGIFFKGVYDLKLPVKLVLTGSSTLEIKSGIYEPLTGRKRIFELYPFSFFEQLSYHDPSSARLVSTGEVISSYTRKHVMEYLLSFANWGGYPRVALEPNVAEKKQILKEIFSSYIEKDIIGFLKIKNQHAFVKLVSLLASQIGQLVNIEEVSRTLRIERKTLERYLEFLEKTFVVKLIPPFFTNVRKELTKMNKIYFLDSGFRNFALRYFADLEIRQDRGALLENFVFSEIYKQTDLKIHYWRTKEKAEVDFVIEDYKGTIMPIEVKATALKEPGMTRSFRSFIKKYKPPRAVLVNLSYSGKTRIDKTEVLFIQPYELALSINSN